MQLVLLLLPLLLLVPLAEAALSSGKKHQHQHEHKDELPTAGWECGTDRLTKAIAEAEINTHCPQQKDSINDCCKAHDACYDAQKGRDFCDGVFCECLTTAAGDSQVCRDEDTPLFCQLVRTFGEDAYERASRNESLVEEDDEGSGWDDYEDDVVSSDDKEAKEKSKDEIAKNVDAIVAVAEKLDSTASPPLHLRVRRLANFITHRVRLAPSGYLPEEEQRRR